jgi:hypothetical protein
MTPYLIVGGLAVLGFGGFTAFSSKFRGGISAAASGISKTVETIGTAVGKVGTGIAAAEDVVASAGSATISLYQSVTGTQQTGGGREGWIDYVQPRTDATIHELNNQIIGLRATVQDWRAAKTYIYGISGNYAIRGRSGVGPGLGAVVKTWASWEKTYQTLGKSTS